MVILYAKPCVGAWGVEHRVGAGACMQMRGGRLRLVLSWHVSMISNTHSV